MFVFNLQILKYIGDIGVSMYGVITNTAIVVICLCNGINQASQPIISTNHGAGLIDRIETVKKLGLKTAFIHLLRSGYFRIDRTKFVYLYFYESK